MLESLFLQAAAVDGAFQIKQWNQPDIAIREAPYQHLKPLVQQLCTRNRTRDGEDARDETRGLEEIDKEATESGIKAMQEDDRLIMDITRTGSTWTRSAAYWAGQAEDKRCQICMEADESADHFWICKGLKEAREEADPCIAKWNIESIPHPIRQGIAPAMSANGCGTFWGTCEKQEGTTDAQWEAFRADAAEKADWRVKGKIKTFEPKVKPVR